MTNLEAARIMMDGSGGSPVDEVHKLIITNGTFTPDAGQMWNLVAINHDRYYSDYGDYQDLMNYNWELYSHLNSLNHGYHFKMGSKYHVKVQADGKYYPKMSYWISSEKNYDPTIYEKYFVSWNQRNGSGVMDNFGFTIFPSMFFTIYENDNPIPIFITQNPFWDNGEYWERRVEFQLTDTIHSGGQQRVIAGQPKYTGDPPKNISYRFWNYIPNPGTNIAPCLQLYCSLTHEVTEYSISNYHVDGTTDPPSIYDATSTTLISIYPPFYYRTRWHSVDGESAMYHVLRMQTDINLNGLYTGEYNEQSS